MTCLKLLIWIIFHFCSVQCDNSTAFNQWKTQHPDGYNQSITIKSVAAAQLSYSANQQVIEDHNKNASTTYLMAANDNAAMTAAERLKYRKGYKSRNDTSSSKNSSSINSNVISHGMMKRATSTQKPTSKAIVTKARTPQTTKASSTLSTKKIQVTTKLTTKLTTKSTSTTTQKKKQKREAIFEQHRRFKRQTIPTTYDISPGMPVKNQYNCGASWAFTAVSLVFNLYSKTSIIFNI